MAKADLYTITGTKKGTETLPASFDEKVNLNLLAQAIRVYEDSGHTGLSKTKTRGEVNRTTKKLYKQKGTGGARHGSRRAPIFVGGGIAHGPRPVKKVLSLTKKLTKKALNMALSAKTLGHELLMVDLETVKKTKEVANFLKRVIKETKKRKFTIVLSDKNSGLRKYAKNLKNVNTILYKDLNAYQVFLGGLLILDKGLFQKKETKKVAKSDEKLIKSKKTKVAKK